MNTPNKRAPLLELICFADISFAQASEQRYEMTKRNEHEEGIAPRVTSQPTCAAG